MATKTVYTSGTRAKATRLNESDLNALLDATTFALSAWDDDNHAGITYEQMATAQEKVLDMLRKVRADARSRKNSNA